MSGEQPIVVFAGAPLAATARVLAYLASLARPYVIAADSGASTALQFGLTPDVVIGDLDSLQPSVREALERQPVRFERYPRAKDATDGQLALEYALARRPPAVLLLGYLNGPRLDMTLSAVLLLLLHTNQGTTERTPVTLADEHNESVLLRGPASHTWVPESDEVISLLPLSADCGGVTTDGLRYPLDGETLTLGDTRGISNEPLGDRVRVQVQSGALLITRHFPQL